MKRIASVLAIVMLGLSLSLQAPHLANAKADAGGTRQPNILFILTDDQRWDTLAHLTRPDGVEVTPMPNVEKLISDKGVTFTNYYDTIGLCCPSRTAILRGQYAQRTHVYFNQGPYGGWPAFQENECDLANIATTLQGAGYRTALIGKFLNGYQHDQASIVPPGWDVWRALTDTSYFNFWESVDGVDTSFAGYQTDVLGKQARDFIQTGSDQPFFLYWAPHAPHAPATPNRHDRGSFDWMRADDGHWRPDSYDEPDNSDKPAVVQAPTMPQTLIDDTDDFRARQYESLQAVDRWIGTLIGALTPDQLANTLIVFTSDNGMMWGEHRLAMMKNVPYEEAIRGPFVARWDGVIPAGTTDGHLGVNIDIAPTFAEIAGATIPYDLDGVSLMPMLTGTVDGWRHAFLLEHGGGGDLTYAPDYLGVRADASWFHGAKKAPYTYIHYVTGEMELYNLKTDPLELDNLASVPGYEDIIAVLQGWLDAQDFATPPTWHKGNRYPGPVLDEDADG